MRSDEQLRRDVLSWLLGDARVRVFDLDVEVERCVVTLRGRVGSDGERWTAAEAARRVAGLAPVFNGLVVCPEADGGGDAPRG